MRTRNHPPIRMTFDVQCHDGEVLANLYAVLHKDGNGLHGESLWVFLQHLEELVRDAEPDELLPEDDWSSVARYCETIARIVREKIEMG